MTREKITLEQEDSWDIVIKPRSSNFSFNLDEVWKYRDLVAMYIRRDIVTMYKQTVLGPIWFIIQPLMTTFVFMFVFGNIASIPTDGLPQMLFYLAGLLAWGYFSDCMTRISFTFSTNAHVFSKVYFPRLVVPVSVLISSLLKFVIQLLLFIGIYLYFYLNGYDIQPNIYLLLLPLYILILGGLALGFGIIISSMTTKYRDLALLFSFLTQLWMYGTPIAYPLSLAYERYPAAAWLIEINPLTSIVEAMRYSFMGAGSFSWSGIAYSFIFMVFVVILGVWMFNKVERKFVDVV